MVSTRAMAARKVPAACDKENDSQLALRKKPVRRATAKAATASAPAATTVKPARKATAAIVEPPVLKAAPLSPKKITQVARAKAVDQPAEVKKAAPRARATAPTTSTVAKSNAATTSARSTRATRAAPVAAPKPAPSKPSPRKAPVTRRKAALPAAARGKSARTKKVEPQPLPKHEAITEPEADQEDGPEAEHEDEHEAVQEEPHLSPAEEPEDEVEEQEAEAEAEAEEEKQLDEEEKEEENDQQEDVTSLEDNNTRQASESEEYEQAAGVAPKIKATQPDETQLEEEEEEGDANESDDELCGPKTPMRRGLTPASRQSSFPSAARRLQTPARRLVLHRAHRGTPQTQRVPLKSSASLSPQRPMTVSRGANKAFVFRPLKQLSQSPQRKLEKTPSTAQHQQDDQAEFEHDQNEEEYASESSADELHEPEDPRTISTQPSPAYKVDFDLEESESEDELAKEDSASESSEEDDTIIEIDEEKESDYEDIGPDVAQETSDVSCSIVDDGDIDDSILPEPQIPTYLLQSSPASVTAHEIDIDIDLEDSELASSPAPSTPASVIRRNLDYEDSPTEEVLPASRLSITDSELLSDNEGDVEATPNIKSRVSFSTATAKMLQTPRMQFALGGNTGCETEDSPSVHASEQMDIDEEKILTINPALLGVDEDGVDLSLKLENAASIPTPYFETPARERMSIGLDKEGRMTLLEDDIMDLVDLDHESPIKPEISNTMAEVSQALVQTQELVTPRPVTSRRQSYMTAPRAVMYEETPKTQRMETILPTPPSYARSTFAFDARRKSMPAISAVTPDNNVQRPRTSDTNVKTSINSSLFMKLWADKQIRPSIRRSTSGFASVPSDVHTPVFEEPLTVHKRDSTPLQRSSTTIQLQPASPYVPFYGSKPRRHTPTPVQKPLSPQKRHSAPRTPMKTPLKAPGATPGAYPMTPHPSAPLKHITALVEVFTLDGSSASSPFIALLQRLGARTTKTWSERVTHVIFKDGSPTTLQKVRLAHKEGKEIFCVNSRWVTDCDREGKRMDEDSEVYAVDVEEIPRGGRRRRKSMEPAALRNLDGNVVGGGSGDRGRKMSFGRKSMSRMSLASSFWGESPEKTPAVARNEDWRYEDEDSEVEAFFAEPTERLEIPTGFGAVELGQRTAPVDRVRKLRFGDDDSRRLTFVLGRE